MLSSDLLMYLALVCFCFEAGHKLTRRQEREKQRVKQYSHARYIATRDAKNSGKSEATHFSMVEFHGCLLVLNVLAFSFSCILILCVCFVCSCLCIFSPRTTLSIVHKWLAGLQQPSSARLTKTELHRPKPGYNEGIIGSFTQSDCGHARLCV